MMPAYGSDLIVDMLRLLEVEYVALVPVGTRIDDPPPDLARVAQGMGVWAAGPIDDPAALGPALRQAVDVVRDGRPALVDVVTE